MRDLKILAALGLLSTAGVAHADFSANATFVSDYDFRGISQTGEEPAVQVGIDWEHSSGWYVGSWASNVDFGTEDPSHEVNVYTGFSGELGNGIGWDVGILQYIYPGDSDAAFPELYGGLSYGWFSGKLAYAESYLGDYTDESAWYVAGDLSIPLGEVSLDLHAGHSGGDGVKMIFGDAYSDYSVGLTYSAANFDIGLKWVTTDADGYGDHVVLSMGTSFPWK